MGNFRLMKAQTLGDTSSLEFMRGRRILEINPDHPVMKDLHVSYFVIFCFSNSCIVNREFMMIKLKDIGLSKKF